jgi:hypothetical protein
VGKTLENAVLLPPIELHTTHGISGSAAVAHIRAELQ